MTFEHLNKFKNTKIFTIVASSGVTDSQAQHPVQFTHTLAMPLRPPAIQGNTPLATSSQDVTENVQCCIARARKMAMLEQNAIVFVGTCMARIS